MLEKRVEEYLKEQVKKHGGLCLKFVSPCTAGVPDRVVILNGVHFVELKRPEGGVLSKVQTAMHKRFERAGARVWVIRNREEVMRFVHEICSS